MTGSKLFIPNAFRKDTRGQAYTLEAIVSVTLIFTVVLFIAPSIATTPGNEDVEQLQMETELSDDVVTMLDQHASNGELKSLMLNYNERWVTDYPGDGSYNYGPDSPPFASPDEGGDESHYLTAPGPVGHSIEEIEEKHDVSIAVYLTPESTTTTSDPDRVEFIRSSTQETSIVGAESTEITLYDDDRLRSEPGPHAQTGSEIPQTEGNGDRLIDTDDFPIEEAEDTGSDDTVYNTVNVQVIVYDDTAEDEE